MSAGAEDCGCSALGVGLRGAALDQVIGRIEADRLRILRDAGLASTRADGRMGSHSREVGQDGTIEDLDVDTTEVLDAMSTCAAYPGGANAEYDHCDGSGTGNALKCEADWIAATVVSTDFDIKRCSLLSQTDQDNLEKVIQQAMVSWNIPSGAFALMSPVRVTLVAGSRVVTPPRLVYAAGFTYYPAFASQGFPEESPKESAEFPVASPTTLFRIGSISKTITALGVLRAVEKGLLSLDDVALNYVNFIYPTAINRTITVRMLLAHTSGLPRDADERAIAEEIGGYPVSRDATFDYMVRHGELEFLPGHPDTSTDTYSNYGYQVLEAILEAATGVNFTEWIRTEVLYRLGMHRTTEAATETRAGAEVCYYANRISCGCECVEDCTPLYATRSVMKKSQPCVRAPYGAANYEEHRGPYGWLSCTKDLMRLMRGFILGYHDKMPTFLSSATCKEMVADGLGWSVNVGREGSFHHGGRGCGITSMLRCSKIASGSSQNQASLCYLFNVDLSRDCRSAIYERVENFVEGFTEVDATLGVSVTYGPIDFSAISGDLYVSTCIGS